MKTDRQETDEQGGEPPGEGAGTFDRSFKYALIAYAVVEFIAIALVVYYQATR
ncbi:MAG TPA: hypothetical protein VGB98_22285 [Pyrinomonadaceae bacterium]|jgi:hypothetical protein